MLGSGGSHGVHTHDTNLLRPPKGLRNLNNTCYINSALQMLSAAPLFRFLCLRLKAADRSMVQRLSPQCRSILGVANELLLWWESTEETFTPL